MSTANYQQGEDSVTLYVRVDNVAENVPDYFFDSIRIRLQRSIEHHA